jgi:carbon-monoxide dehydrogenase small subunit
MLLSALDLLHRETSPSRERIREELSGNICRCTGYMGIVDAVEAAATELNAPVDDRSVLRSDRSAPA